MPFKGAPMINVTIEKIETFLVNLPAKAVFMLAGGQFAAPGAPSPRVLCKVTGSNGVVGWGEATPCPTWTYETSETLITTLRNYLAPAVTGMPAWDLDAINRKMDRVICPGVTIGQPLAKSALDVAIHDMIARTLGIPFYQLLGRKRRDTIELGYIVTTDRPSGARDLVKKGLDLGYNAFKVKIGIHGEREDLEIVEVTRDAIGDRFLWVDANQGYRVDEAIRQAHRMEELGVAAFEQPLKGNSIAQFQRLVRTSRVPIALDEAIRSPADLLEFIRFDALDIAIAKVQRSGGMWWSRQFCELAENAGIRLMASGLCESDIGFATGLHLCAAFGVDTPVDLNGRQFVESAYVGQTVKVEGGTATIPDTPGLGVEVDEDAVRRLAVEIECR
jgi:muconate cycloisomerase